MAYQGNGDITKSGALGTFVDGLKFKFTNAANGTVSILEGNELIANGGSIVATTNTNACVVTVTLNCSLPAVKDVWADWRDDGQAGFWCSTGNVTNEGNTNVCTFKIGFYNAGGATVTTNNVNANAVVVGVGLIFRNIGVDKGV